MKLDDEPRRATATATELCKAGLIITPRTLTTKARRGEVPSERTADNILLFRARQVAESLLAQTD